jgi:hypothetical protein
MVRKTRADHAARMLTHIFSAVMLRDAAHPISQRRLGTITAVSGMLDRPVEPDDDTEVLFDN